MVVDEVHTLARDKRGSHLALSLERLSRLAGEQGVRLQRIGLSATQRPLEVVARLLRAPPAAGRRLPSWTAGTSAIWTWTSKSRGVSSRRWPAASSWATSSIGSPPTYSSTAPPWSSSTPARWLNGWPTSSLSASGPTPTLPTRPAPSILPARTGGRWTRTAIPEVDRIDAALQVAAHHGSLSAARRRIVEQRLRAGDLRALVATASLELGIDVGPVELVCQIGSPRAIGTFLQRVGRANHHREGTPAGRLYPLTRDELVECTALLAGVRAGHLDVLQPPVAPLDVLAQQLVAEVAAEGEWEVDPLYALARGAAPYADLSRQTFDEVVDMVRGGSPPGAVDAVPTSTTTRSTVGSAPAGAPGLPP